MIGELKPYAEYQRSGIPWLGQIPAHWSVQRLKSLATNVNDQTFRMSGSEVYIALEHVESWTGRARPQTDSSLFSGQVKRFVRGDVLFGKLRPYLAKVYRPGRDGVCSGEFFVLRARDETLLPEYLAYQLLMSHSIDMITASTFGAKMPRADWGFVGNHVITVPPPEEQTAIVRFLDWANGRLERAIRAKRKVIALLDEQKQAIIHRAVTRGLDSSVPLKPSGVPWLGDIPQPWVVRRIASFARVGNGSTPSRGQPAYWVGGSYPWLNSSQINRGLIDSADQFVTPTALRECHLPKVPAGSVLVAITGQGKTRGMSAVLAVEATINQHVAYIAPRVPLASTHFLKLALTAAYPQLRAISEDAGSTKGALTCEDLKRFKLAFPPRDEQDKLLKQIASDTGQLDKAILRLESEAEHLREYRARLIADVVTGKLDVREAVARLPDSPAPLDDEPELDGPPQSEEEQAEA